MAYVNVYDNGGGIRKVAVLDNVRNIIGTTTDGGQTGANLAAELAALVSRDAMIGTAIVRQPEAA